MQWLFWFKGSKFRGSKVLVDFQPGIDKLSEEEKITHAGRLDEVPHIFSKMPPIPIAIESYKKLAAVYDTYIFSTSPWENPAAGHDKLIWVNQYLGEELYKRLILSHHKHL